MVGTKSEDAKLGRFEIIDQLGAGGMGTVYRAFDPRLKRNLAIKVLGTSGPTLAPGTTLRLRELSPELMFAKERRIELANTPATDVLDDEGAPSEASVDLLAEARAMAQLSHPNVVSVYEIGSAGDQLFIAMELVDGLNLSQWLAQETRSRDDILAMFRQAAAGLAAAHRAGLVHRDFKPDNVLVSDDGLAQVADFGLAVGQLQRKQFIGTKTVVAGTPHYMAPEILAGAAHSPRSDVFSFCVALFEALGGAHRGARMDLAEATAKVKSLGRLPRSLRSGLARGLCADASLRPENGAALETMLASRRARRTSIAVLGISAVSIGAAVFAMSRSEQPSCDAPWQRMDGTWNPDREAAIRASIAGVLGADSRRKSDTVVSAFDKSAKQLRVKHRDVCVSRQRGELTAEASVSEQRCIEERMIKFEALLDTFGRQIKAEDVERLSKLAESEPVTLCGQSLPRFDDETLALRQDWERLRIEEKLGQKTLEVTHAEFLELTNRPAAKNDKRLWAELVFERWRYERLLKLESPDTTLREAVAAARDAGHVTQELRATLELVKLALRTERSEEAETLLTGVEPLTAKPEVSPGLRARFHLQKARLERHGNNHEPYLAELRLALAAARRVAGTTNELHVLHAAIASDLATALTFGGELEEALELRKQLVASELERDGRLSHKYLHQLARFGKLSVKLGRVEEGLYAVEQAIQGLSEPENAKHVRELNVAVFLKADALAAANRHREALVIYDQVAEKSAAQRTNARWAAASSSSSIGDGIDLERRAREILAAQIKQYGESHVGVAIAWFYIGYAALLRGELDRVGPAITKARSIRERVDSKKRTEEWLRPLVSKLALQRKRYDEAEPLLRASVRKAASNPLFPVAGRGELRADHALCLLELGRPEEALEAAKVAERELKGGTPAPRAKARFILGRAEYATGNRDKGLELARSALDELREHDAKSARDVKTWLAKHRKRR